MRGRKSALIIVLPPADRAAIEHWLRSAKTPAGLARRGRLLLLLEQGRSLKETAATCGLSARHVRKWAQRYRDEGLAGRRGKPPPGRKPGLSPPRGPPPPHDGLRAARGARPIAELLGLPGAGRPTGRRGDRAEHLRRDRPAHPGGSPLEAVALPSLALPQGAPR